MLQDLEIEPYVSSSTLTLITTQLLITTLIVRWEERQTEMMRLPTTVKIINGTLSISDIAEQLEEPIGKGSLRDSPWLRTSQTRTTI